MRYLVAFKRRDGTILLGVSMGEMISKNGVLYTIIDTLSTKCYKIKTNKLIKLDISDIHRLEQRLNLPFVENDLRPARVPTFNEDDVVNIFVNRISKKIKLNTDRFTTSYLTDKGMSYCKIVRKLSTLVYCIRVYGYATHDMGNRVRYILQTDFPDKKII